MGKCRNCAVEILDEAECCPLCQTVLEQTEPLENMYPDIRLKMRRLLLVSRIYLFCAILTEGVLISVNLQEARELSWSVIAGLALLLGYIVFRYGVIGRANHQNKAIVLALAAVLCAIGIDFALGYSGWSLDFAIPIGILGVDLFILICMICNHRNWQSYIMWQLLMLLLSLIPAGLFLAELEHVPYMAFLPLVVSAGIFLGTMLIGDRRAVEELRRRFHCR